MATYGRGRCGGRGGRRWCSCLRFKKKKVDRGDCADLNEVDKAILEELARRGGATDRVELHEALSIPKTTLHRHLHKLARYGYVRLVQQGGRQRVELIRKC
ncbi:helix-turn-helix transcriptional regulator [Pyrobaculum ferrireducens]|uniref:helix-turn-helix transcriptional regulator n=1 Tax=Pyrobaculum ferrireducens TaxID=1104324 RepID=UPI001F000F61|nr:helix-turn-helix domain-containing protein [Pyrobaculum ferrireducens]